MNSPLAAHNTTPASNNIVYPYIDPRGHIEYVPADDPFMAQAKAYAKEHSLDSLMPNCSLLVKDGKVIGRGANGSNYHDTHGCERVRQNIPTGEGYELCEGCHPKNHGEPKAIADATANGNDPNGGTMYLWGHWWCCKPCWDSMVEHGITTVRLLQDSQKLFNKADPGNIIGKQFA